MGTLILKDALVFVAILAGAIAFTFSSKRSFLILITVSSLLLGLTRPSFIFLLAFGIAFCQFRRRSVFVLISSMAVCLLVWYFASRFGQINNAVELIYDQEITGYTYDMPNQMALYNIVGYYPDLPLYKKIILLPFTAVVQFFIPFPWTMIRDIPFGLTEVWAHIGFPWYVFGFVLGYYFVSKWRDYRSLSFRISVWALLCWLTPCLLFAGTVSRYGLPFVALFAPAVAMTIVRNVSNKKFYIALSCYSVVVAAILIFAYHLQTSATL